MKGKLLPDQSQILKVMFYTKTSTDVKSEIIIQLRGGKD